MLQATRDAVDILHCSESPPPPMLFNLLAFAAEYGSHADAVALLPFALTQRMASDKIIAVVAAHGDREIGRTLFEHWFPEGQLKHNAPPEVLRAVGYLGYELVEPVLWHYARRLEPAVVAQSDEDSWFGWSHSVNAILGLLHLPCASLREDLAREIDGCIEAHCHPIMLPALTAKTGDWDLLMRAYAWHDEHYTYDGEAVLLGLALFGPRGDRLFREILWNRRWEVGGGKGVQWWAYVGCQALGIHVANLFEEVRMRIQNERDPKQIQHDLQLLVELLRVRIIAPRPLRFVPAWIDRLDALRNTMFSDDYGSTLHPRNSILQLLLDQDCIDFHDMQTELREIHHRLNHCIREELIRRESGS